MDDEEDFDYLPPANTNRLDIPNDPALLAVYEVYKSPLEANRFIFSERNRSTFAEALNGPSVPTLAELCVRQLAKRGPAYVPASVRDDPLKMRIYYDSLDVELPLRECYFVEDASFWRRVVLAKTRDTCLCMKSLQDYDWRGKGLSLKYVELVEACPASLWPEREMSELAELIKDHVRTMEIRHLQSLTEYAFRRRINDDDDTEPDITSEESGAIEVSSDEPMTSEEGGEEEEAEAEETESNHSGTKKVIGFNTNTNFVINFDDDDEDDVATNDRRKRRMDRNAARQKLREMNAIKQAEHEERVRRRAENRMPKEPEPPSKRRKKKQPIEGVFDIRVDPEPEDGEDKVMDKRNKQKYLQHLQRLEYPEDECHHIDLSFLRHFVNLVSLHLEFLGPEVGRDYHKRHALFSLKDIVHLSRGLAALEQLKIFRLRNSRLNNIKVYPLCRALHSLPLLEVVDLGFNQMTDDCGKELGFLLERPRMLKALELEYNCLETRTMAAIAEALQQPSDSWLEYLGLAHNRMGGDSLSILCNGIKGTGHVEEINLSGIEANPHTFVQEIGELVRHHDPLRRLKMVAIPLSSKLGNKLICALNANMNITEFDCRECDLDEDQELDADLAIRRNVFMQESTFMRDTARFPSTSDLLEFSKTVRHPMVQKIEEDMARKKECLENYPPPTPSAISTKTVSLVVQESEYDIWRVLGITQNKPTKESSPPVEPEKKESVVSFQVPEPFNYDPNSFDLDQFREHVSQLGPSNRHSYFLKQRQSFI
ncbi:uncharacterized protein LOC108100320 [Drosophila ficusphila]|uniref:uncharacterized protein LOC108100320 n=1 Tax=Drosophila ficusphila TaxID=30025 RepID=UPI0007E81F50|nr:uncharacterized protein LOC108100320 [Drosophila ficusphila]